MKRAIILAVLLGAAAVATGCAQLGPVYYKKAQEFSFHPPAGWRHNPPEEEITIFQSHHVKGYDFRPTLTIVVEDTEIMTVEEYMEKQLEALRKLPAYQRGEETSVGNFDAWRLMYKYYNPHYKVDLRAVTQLMLRNTRIYAATYVAPRKLWRSYKGLFLDSLDTFKFGEEAIPPGYKGDAYSKPELGTK